MRHALRSERGALSRAAEALGCQRSYLSRVMNSEVQLTPDQAYLLCEHWQLTGLHAEYFQTLVEHERASSREYRQSLDAKLENQRKTHASLTEKLQRPAPNLASEEQATYFSSWIWCALHFLTSCEEFQSPDRIAGKLGLPTSTALVYLEQLQKMGMVRKERTKWAFNGGQFHLPHHSPYVLMHHQNWRSQALLDAQNPQSNGIHYTNVQTISRRDLQKAKELLLDFIESTKAVFDPSEPEVAAALTCDFFEI